MAFEYFKYDTGYTNTLVARSNISFAPLSPPYKEIYYQIFIPETQPLYFYRESGGTIIPNTQENIDAYLSGSGVIQPPTADDNVTYGQFSATTAQLSATYLSIDNFNTYSGQTLTNINSRLLSSVFNTYTGTTAPATYVTNTEFNTYTGITNTRIDSKASLSGATFTGVVNGLTAVADTNTTQFATTAYVVGQASTTNPLMNGTVAIGTSLRYARADHVHPRDTSKLSLSGGTMTGELIGTIFSGNTCIISPIICTTSVGAGQVVFGNPTTSVLIGSSSFVYNPTTCMLCVGNIQKTSNDGYLYSECLTNRTTTSTTCVKGHGYSATTASGIYKVDINVLYGNRTSNACTLVEMKIDNVIQGSKILGKNATAGWTASAFITKDVKFTKALHCIDIWFWNAGGTACLPLSTIRLERIC